MQKFSNKLKRIFLYFNPGKRELFKKKLTRKKLHLKFIHSKELNLSLDKCLEVKSVNGK